MQRRMRLADGLGTCGLLQKQKFRRPSMPPEWPDWHGPTAKEGIWIVIIFTFVRVCIRCMLDKPSRERRASDRDMAGAKTEKQPQP